MVPKEFKKVSFENVSTTQLDQGLFFERSGKNYFLQLSSLKAVEIPRLMPHKWVVQDRYVVMAPKVGDDAMIYDISTGSQQSFLGDSRIRIVDQRYLMDGVHGLFDVEKWRFYEGFMSVRQGWIYRGHMDSTSNTYLLKGLRAFHADLDFEIRWSFEGKVVPIPNSLSWFWIQKDGTLRVVDSSIDLYVVNGEFQSAVPVPGIQAPVDDVIVSPDGRYATLVRQENQEIVELRRFQDD